MHSQIWLYAVTTKSWRQSLTIWAAIVFIGLLLTFVALTWLDADARYLDEAWKMISGLFGVLIVALRVLRTNEPIERKKK